MDRPTSVTFCDTETTGLEPRNPHYIIQLAYIKVEHTSATELREIKTKEMKLQLPPGVVVPPDVARMNGYDPEVWAKEAIPREEAIDTFLKDLTGSSFGGQNPCFDYRHIDEELFRQRRTWPRMANYSLFSVDGMARPLMLAGHVKNVKQETLCAFFNLGTQTHDALDDIRQAVEIYKRLLVLSTSFDKATLAKVRSAEFK